MNKTDNIISKNSGFTLVELMVSTTIFIIITISSIGALLVLMGATRDSRGLRFAMDNVNFAMESMTRSIRMGIDYNCSADYNALHADCPSGNNIITFTPQAGTVSGSDKITYKLSQRNDYTYTIKRCVGSLENSCIDIVSSDVNIEVLRFFVVGSDPTDATQAKVYILLKGSVVVKGKKTSFMIQTLASQRNY